MIFLAKVQWFIFMSLLVILLLNLLIAMMGDTYAKIAEIKNEWMRQWARMVLMIERSIPPKERLRQQNRYQQGWGQMGEVILLSPQVLRH